MSRRITAWRGGLALALLVALAASSAAQTTLGRLAGTVLDSSGAVLPGATVTLTSEQTNQVQTTVSSETGAFLFPQVPVGTYKVEIGLQGFKSATFTKVSVAVGQEYALTARLELGNVSENVTVEAGTSLVPTTSPEVTTTVEQQQIVSLPLNGRNPISLVQLQAGVASLGRTNTAINGGRPTWTQVTQDGINIQDNFIRTNSVDFVPNRPTADNVSEFSIVTTAQGADNAGGASQVRLITPSGTNALRGNAYEYNRHSKFAENTFFNKRTNVPVPYLNRNQFGGSVGGPIMKQKLFFYANYEAFRQDQQVGANFTIPVRSDLLAGNFRYVSSVDGSVQQVNVLQLSGQTIDPAVQSSILSLYPSPDKVNSYDSGDSRADRILNTARYRFQQDDWTDRDQWVTRTDYEHNANHRFEFVYSYIKEVDGRTDIDEVNIVPLASTDAHTHRYVGSWRWMASSRLQNEFRAGGNLSPVDFVTDVDFSSGVLLNVPGIASLGSPLVTFQPQGRDTRTYQYSDTANLMLGNHALQFGGSIEQIRVNAYNFGARFPSVTFGLSSAAPAGIQLTAAQLPGISSTDLTSANNLVAMLSGAITSLSQTFQVQSATSGYVPGVPNDRNWSLDNYSLFIQDNWRWKPNVTVRAGLKWDYFSPTREDNNLAFVPVLNGQTAAQASMNPATTVSFADGGLWNSDLNNFGPTLGVAWDPFKDGKTSIRAGYSLTFVNEEGITVGTNMAANAGLSTAVSRTNLFQRLAAGKPVIATPEFKTTRTMADQIGVSLTSPIRAVNQDIKQPHVHQFSAGVTREIMWNMAVEARYVGSRGRDIWRGIDLNQLDAIGALGGAFAADFQRARQNGFLSLAQGGAFDPNFNTNIPGSQQLTVLPTFGQLGNATARTAIQQNELARLADFYMSTAGGPTTAARAAFLANPAIYTSEYMDNTSFQDYDALQVELRRQFRHGIFGQINYTLSETRSDSIGSGSQSRVEPFLDNARPQLDEGYSIYHNAHVINANAVVELPFGSGKPFLNGGGLSNAVFGGWQLATIVKWQSGAPLSITSGRGTFNRTGRSGRQTAVTSLTPEQVKALFGVRELADGRIFFIDPKVVNPNDGRLVAPDSQSGAGFNGQEFFNPAAGQVGSLEVNLFEGPSQFVTDFTVQKGIRFGGRYNTIIRADVFNLFNTVNWNFGDLDINSTTAGRITGTGGARLMQFSIKFEF
jgi:Carboxypeptidase regulatory-like domain/TonB dependent receptor-like, beta-barrel